MRQDHNALRGAIRRAAFAGALALTAALERMPRLRRRFRSRLSGRRRDDFANQGRRRPPSRKRWRCSARLRRRRPSAATPGITSARRCSARSPSRARKMVDQHVLAIYFDKGGKVDANRQLRHEGRRGLRLRVAHHADRRRGAELPAQHVPGPVPLQLTRTAAGTSAQPLRHGDCVARRGGRHVFPT